jgi:hypothetical protein
MSNDQNEQPFLTGNPPTRSLFWLGSLHCSHPRGKLRQRRARSVDDYYDGIPAPCLHRHKLHGQAAAKKPAPKRAT